LSIRNRSSGATSDMVGPSRKKYGPSNSLSGAPQSAGVAPRTAHGHDGLPLAIKQRLAVSGPHRVLPAAARERPSRSRDGWKRPYEDGVLTRFVRFERQPASVWCNPSTAFAGRRRQQGLDAAIASHANNPEIGRGPGRDAIRSKVTKDDAPIRRPGRRQVCARRQSLDIASAIGRTHEDAGTAFVRR
jgi:hypothetical protein